MLSQPGFRVSRLSILSTLDKLQARVARSCLSLRSGSSIDWLTPKEELNRLCNWSSLQFRRHILCLCFFHHLYYYFPDLLTDFGFRKSHSSRHPSSLILPKVGSHFGNSYLFRFSIAWNNLDEQIRVVKSSKQFSNQLHSTYRKYKYSLSGLIHLFL